MPAWHCALEVEHQDLANLAAGDEQVAVRCKADDPRVLDPEATISILKPSGTFGMAPSGIGTVPGALDADSVPPEPEGPLR